jgi:hypothetical protein
MSSFLVFYLIFINLDQHFIFSVKFHQNVKLMLGLKPLLWLFFFSPFFSFFLFGVEIFENILRKKTEARPLELTEFTRFRRLALLQAIIK